MEYFCPGEALPINRSLHLARLSAAWEVCDRCPQRFETEGLSDRATEGLSAIRGHRSSGLQRTACGVRGRWMTDIDRQIAADLTALFLNALNSERTSILIGIDDRAASMDLAIGVASAARNCGWDVIQIGRCSLASLHFAIRSNENCAMAVMVTGCGRPAAWSGLDVFDAVGEPIVVRWSDFGVGLSTSGASPGPHQSSPSESFSMLNDPAARPADRIQMILRGATEHPQTSMAIRHSESLPSEFYLTLPDANVRRRWHSRHGRSAGQEHVSDVESDYRNWLLRWFPVSGVRFVVVTDDALIRDRWQWLHERRPINGGVCSNSEHHSSASTQMTIVIDEDDREFEVFDKQGKVVPSQELANCINRRRLDRAQLGAPESWLAHADLPSGKFWLTESTLRVQPRSLGTVEVSDALLTLALLTASGVNAER